MADQKNPKECLYIFLDEAGNFDFSHSGTTYFMLTSLTKYRPFEAYKALTELKYDLIEFGQDMDCFHASEDTQATRNRVFDIISAHLSEVRLDCLIAEKQQIAPELHKDDEFYSGMIRELLRHVDRRGEPARNKQGGGDYRSHSGSQKAELPTQKSGLLPSASRFNGDQERPRSL